MMIINVYKQQVNARLKAVQEENQILSQKLEIETESRTEIEGNHLHVWWVIIFISRGAEGPGREILQRPPSVCLSVTFSFRTVTQKRIAVFSRNFAGTCTKSWGCSV